MMQNPLRNHLSDDTFKFLIENNLLREKGIRDFYIRKKFNQLKNDYPTYVIIEMIQEDYPYLQYETVRKIIYQKPGAKEFDINSILTA